MSPWISVKSNHVIKVETSSSSIIWSCHVLLTWQDLNHNSLVQVCFSLFIAILLSLRFLAQKWYSKFRTLCKALTIVPRMYFVCGWIIYIHMKRFSISLKCWFFYTTPDLNQNLWKWNKRIWCLSKLLISIWWLSG